MNYTATVSGATGAVGRELISLLVSSTNCVRVVALTRREIPQDQWQRAFPSIDLTAAKDKLQIRSVDYKALTQNDISVNGPPQAVFCCLGTTRKDAGSAEAFREVDLHYVSNFAQVAKEQNVSYFGLLTASNANKSSWFLYPQTKGEVEDVVQKLNFPKLGIFQPGLLERGDAARSAEKVFSYIVPSIKVHAVAKAMITDFETTRDVTTKIWSHKEMKSFEIASEQ